MVESIPLTALALTASAGEVDGLVSVAVVGTESVASSSLPSASPLVSVLVMEASSPSPR